MLQAANIRKTLVSSLSACALMGIASQSAAQEPQISPPTPLKLVNAEAQGFGREGLHHMRFTVKADGTITDAEVTGGFTSPMAARFLVQSIQDWTFTPGTVNGEPTDFYNQEFTIASRLGQGLSVSPEAQNLFDEVSGLKQAGDTRKALRELDRGIKSKVITVLDYSLAHVIKSDILRENEDNFGALDAIRIATSNRLNSAGATQWFLPPDMLEQSLRKRFLLAASIGQNVEAARTWDILERDFDIPDNDPYRAQADAIRGIVDSPEIVSRASIIDKQWSYEPKYRIFAVSSVEGRISRINVRCEQRKELKLDFQENVDWSLPESFGSCTLDFVGRDGTVFNLHEFAE